MLFQNFCRIKHAQTMPKFIMIEDGVLAGDITLVDNTIIQGKLDIGRIGFSGGLDVGTGGSFEDGLLVYTYDSNAASGSRFTQFTDLRADNTFPSNAGDRIYFGYTTIFWGIRFKIKTTKSSEQFVCKYWNGIVMTRVGFMGILKDSANPLRNIIMEQNVEKEYFTWDKNITSLWVTGDNVLNELPNTGSQVCWICLEIPSGGLVQAPITNQIKARGSDFDIITGTGFPVFWGDARVEMQERLSFVSAKKKGGADKQDVDFTSTQKQTVLRFKAVNEYATFIWILPDGIDTSCALHFSMNYYAKIAISTADMELDIKKLINQTAIGSSETSDLLVTTAIEVASGDTYYDQILLTSSGGLMIEELSSGDLLAIQLTRTDSNGGDFFPLSLIIKSIRWTTGHHT